MQTLRTAAIGSTVRVVKLHGEGAIKREMNSAKWTWGAIGYMCGFAYGIAMIVYQLGGLLTGEAAFSAFTVAALALLAGLLYLLFRPYRESGGVRLNERSAARA